MSKPPRIAVIGLGMAVKPHALALRDLQRSGDVVVAGVWSPSEARRRQAADAYGFSALETLDAIAADPAIDAVLLLTPPNARLELVETLCACGKAHPDGEAGRADNGRRRSTWSMCARPRPCVSAWCCSNRFRPPSVRLRALLSRGRARRAGGRAALAAVVAAAILL